MKLPIKRWPESGDRHIWSTTATISAIIIFIFLAASALLNYGWNDWWESLDARLRDGSQLYRDQFYFSGPLYPGVSRLVGKLTGCNIGTAVKATGLIGVLAYALSVVPLVRIAEEKWHEVIYGKGISKRSLKDLGLLLSLTVLTIGGTQALFGTFLRSDDYHTYRAAGFNLIAASAIRYITGTAKASWLILGGLGLGLMLGSRTHEGIITYLCIAWLLGVIWRSRESTVYVVATGLIGLGTALLMLVAVGGTDPLTTVDFVKAIADSSTAKTGASIGDLWSRLLLIYESIGLSLRKLIKIILATATWTGLLFVYEAAFSAGSLGKTIRGKERIALLTVAIASWVALGIYITVKSVDFVVGGALTRLVLAAGIALSVFTLFTAMRDISECAKNNNCEMKRAGRTGLLVVGLAIVPIVAGLASSGLKVEIDYGLAYFYWYAPFLLAAIQAFVKELATTLKIGSVNKKMILGIRLAGGLLIVPRGAACDEAVNSRLTRRWAWWGASPNISLAEQAYNTATKRNARDLPIESRMINSKIFWDINAMPKEFFRELVELCSAYEAIKSSASVNNLRAWSYPSPMPSLACTSTVHISSSRYTTWYDVTGLKAADKELLLIKKERPDVIAIYSVDQALDAHMSAFASGSLMSPIARMGNGLSEEITSHYIYFRSLRVRFGIIRIYVNRDLANTMTKFPETPMATAIIGL